MRFEKPVPPGTGEAKFNAVEADARAGLSERAAEAQRRAAEREKARRGGGEGESPRRERPDKEEAEEDVTRELDDSMRGQFEESEE